MRFGRILLSSTILTLTLVSSSLAAPARRGPTAQKTSTKHKPPVKKISQTTIDPTRATELQTALIKSGYLTGEPSGTWDATTQSAMQKLQADNGWQTKLVPDSRAIIKLGLGPAQDYPATTSSIPATPTQLSSVTTSTPR